MVSHDRRKWHERSLEIHLVIVDFPQVSLMRKQKGLSTWSFLSSSVWSWLVPTTTSSACLTATPSATSPLRRQGRAANHGPSWSHGGSAPPEESAGRTTSAWTAWTSPRRSCTRHGTRMRTSLPLLPPTIYTSSRTNSTPRCIKDQMSALDSNEFTPDHTAMAECTHFWTYTHRNMPNKLTQHQKTHI